MNTLKHSAKSRLEAELLAVRLEAAEDLPELRGLEVALRQARQGAGPGRAEAGGETGRTNIKTLWVFLRVL